MGRYDGPTASAAAVSGSSPDGNGLSGSLNQMSQTEFVATGQQMLVQFTSDESVGAGGFTANYVCNTAAPPPPPPPAPPPPAPPPPAPPACDTHPCDHGRCVTQDRGARCGNQCQYASDGECDEDMGLGTQTYCDLGTDCADCGSRPWFTCECDAGYEGVHCDVVSDPCDRVHCINGGECVRQGMESSCSCLQGFTGDSCETAAPPPPPPAPIVLGEASNGEVASPGGVVYFSFAARADVSYVLETDGQENGLQDTVMTLYDAQENTLAENDDDERVSGHLDSYIEWTCPADGTYTIGVRGFGPDDLGRFTVMVAEAPSSEAGSDGVSDPCSGDGLVLQSDHGEVISYLPS